MNEVPGMQAIKFDDSRPFLEIWNGDRARQRSCLNGMAG
jgi:hypothetical protein